MIKKFNLKNLNNTIFLLAFICKAYVLKESNVRRSYITKQISPSVLYTAHRLNNEFMHSERNNIFRKKTQSFNSVQ